VYCTSLLIQFTNARARAYSKDIVTRGMQTMQLCRDFQPPWMHWVHNTYGQVGSEAQLRSHLCSTELADAVCK